jgi:hypothetical protein
VLGNLPGGDLEQPEAGGEDVFACLEDNDRLPKITIVINP